MHISQPTILPLLSLLLTACPTPTLSQPTLSKRGLPGAVYICTGPNFTQNCGWTMPSNPPTCHIPGTGSQAPRSIGPDPGGVCTLYTSSDCTGSVISTLRFPGIGNGVPEFGSLKCRGESLSVGRRVKGNAEKEEEEEGDGLDEAIDTKKNGDPRLAGGVGSRKRKEVEDRIKEMEKDGFREGIIGLEKGVYY